MKYLFVYGYNGKQNGISTSGNGSVVITVIKGENKITESMIFGEGSAIDIAKEKLKEAGFSDITVCPMGWFKFDDEDEVNHNDT